MVYRDIRAEDLASFRAEVKPEDFTRIIKMACRLNEMPQLKSFLQANLKPQQILVVKGIKRTPQTNTEYAVVSIKGGPNIDFGVQTRYLAVSERKQRHPVTSIFMDLKYSKTKNNR
jgi:hypothetical protein